MNLFSHLNFKMINFLEFQKWILRRCVSDRVQKSLITTFLIASKIVIKTLHLYFSRRTRKKKENLLCSRLATLSTSSGVESHESKQWKFNFSLFLRLWFLFAGEYWLAEEKRQVHVKNKHKVANPDLSRILKSKNFKTCDFQTCGENSKTLQKSMLQRLMHHGYWRCSLGYRQQRWAASTPWISSLLGPHNSANEAIRAILFWDFKNNKYRPRSWETLKFYWVVSCSNYRLSHIMAYSKHKYSSLNYETGNNHLISLRFLKPSMCVNENSLAGSFRIRLLERAFCSIKGSPGLRFYKSFIVVIGLRAVWKGL